MKIYQRKQKALKVGGNMYIYFKYLNLPSKFAHVICDICYVDAEIFFEI